MKDTVAKIETVPLITSGAEEKANTYSLSLASGGEEKEYRALGKLLSRLKEKLPGLFGAKEAPSGGKITKSQRKKLKSAISEVKAMPEGWRARFSEESAEKMLAALSDAEKRLAVLEKAKQSRIERAQTLLAAFPPPVAALLSALLRGENGYFYIFLGENEENTVFFDFSNGVLSEELTFSDAFFLTEEKDAARFSGAIREEEPELCGIGRNDAGDCALLLYYPGIEDSDSFSALLCFRSVALRTFRISVMPAPGESILDGYSILLTLAADAPEQLSAAEKALLPIANAIRSGICPQMPDGKPENRKSDGNAGAELSPEDAASLLLSLLPEGKKKANVLFPKLAALFTLAPWDREEAGRRFQAFLRSPEGEGLDGILRKKLESCERDYPDRFPPRAELRRAEETVLAMAETAFTEAGFTGRFPDFRKTEPDAVRFLTVRIRFSSAGEDGSEEPTSDGGEKALREEILRLDFYSGKLSSDCVAALDGEGNVPDLAACYRKGEGRSTFTVSEKELPFFPEGEDGLPEKTKETLRQYLSGAVNRALERPLTKEERKAVGSPFDQKALTYIVTAGWVLLFLVVASGFFGIVFSLFGILLGLLSAWVTGTPLSEFFRGFPLSEMFSVPLAVMFSATVTAAFVSLLKTGYKRVRFRIRFARRMKKEIRRRTA